VHDVAIQNLDVLFAIDRAGLLEDGPTHSGCFDLSYLRCIPNLVIMAPSDENEVRQMLYTGYMHQGPTAVRYPRGAGPGVEISQQMTAIPIGKATVKRDGKRIAILAFGSMVSASLKAGAEIDATVADMRFVKPLDEELIMQLAASHDLLVTVEENVIQGAAGSAVNELLSLFALDVPILNLGIPDRFIGHDKPANMLANCGLDVDGILRAIKARVHKSQPPIVSVRQ
jgi:1-deoxy-D-xylulose-5-phosphate synthase